MEVVCKCNALLGCTARNEDGGFCQDQTLNSSELGHIDPQRRIILDTVEAVRQPLPGRTDVFVLFCVIAVKNLLRPEFAEGAATALSSRLRGLVCISFSRWSRETPVDSRPPDYGVSTSRRSVAATCRANAGCCASLQVFGRCARPSSNAIERIDRPITMPREISSRSANDNACAERLRFAGRIPPVFEKIL